MATSCCRCGTDIAAKDLSAGFAVRVPTGLVCAGCIDAMSEGGSNGSAQLAALRGVGLITYAVRLSRLPKLKLYSFTTAGGIANHRRTVQSGQPFKAPPLPKPELLKAQIERARTAQRSRRATAIIAVAAGVLVVGGALVMLVIASSKPPEVPTHGLAIATPRYPGTPFQQLAAAMQDSDCPAAERERLLGTVRRDADYMLGEIQKDLDRNHRDEAERWIDQLGGTALIHPELAAQRERLGLLIERFRSGPAKPQAQTAVVTPQPPVPVPKPEPEPATATATATATAPSSQPPETIPKDQQPASVPPVVPVSEPKPPVKPRQPMALLVDNPRFSSPIDKAGITTLELGRVTAGTYQLWFEGGHPQDNETLRLTIADRELVVDGRTLGMRWGKVAGDILLPDGEIRLRIASVNDGWVLREIYVADTALPGPQSAGRVRPIAPALVPSQVPPVGPGESGTLVQLLDHQGPGFQTPAALLTTKAKTTVPSPWPVSIRQLMAVRTLLPGGSRAGIEIPLPERVNAVLVTLNPNRATRKAVAVSLWAKRKLVANLGQSPVQSGWQRIVIPIPATAAAAAGEDPLLLRLEDTVALSMSDPDALLVLSAAGVIGGSPPAAAPQVIPLRFDLQSNRSVQNSIKLTLSQVKSPARTDILANLSTAKREILLVGGDLSADWKGEVRKALDRSGEQGVIKDMRIDPTWWSISQFDLKTDGRTPARTTDFKPIASPAECSLVVLIPNLIEFGSAMDGKKLSAWATTLAQQIIRGDTRAPTPANGGGLWPVFAIGSVDPDKNEQNGKLGDLWAQAIEDLAKIGVPVIDLRSGQRDKAGDTREATALLLDRSLEQIRYQFTVARDALK